MSEFFKATPLSITEHFNPAWFAAVMGTTVIPLALSFFNATWLPQFAFFWIIFSAVVFCLFFVPWTLKFFLYPTNIRKDFNHPVAANFFPTMPISLILFALNLLNFPTLYFSEAVSRQLALYLWGIGTVGIYVFGFIILMHVFRHKGIQLQHANFGWYIPPVSKLLVPLAGYELVGYFPQYHELLLTVSTVSFGTGFFLFLFVGAAVYHRYVYCELPMNRFAATFFIGVAPTSIIAVILFKMAHLFSHYSFLGIDGVVMSSVCVIGVLMSWGFAAWWFLMALIIIIYYIRIMQLPYALSWWAFTFPSGALCVASGAAWSITNFTIIYLFYCVTLFFLLSIWLLVFARTLQGIFSGKVFAPDH